MIVKPRYHYLPEDQAVIDKLQLKATESMYLRLDRPLYGPNRNELERQVRFDRYDFLGPHFYTDESGRLLYTTRVVAIGNANNPFHDEEIFVALTHPISGQTIHDEVWSADGQKPSDLIWTSELVEQHLERLVESEQTAWWNQGTEENPVVLH